MSKFIANISRSKTITNGQPTITTLMEEYSGVQFIKYAPQGGVNNKSHPISFTDKVRLTELK